jgi:hypothetical protein
MVQGRRNLVRYEDDFPVTLPKRTFVEPAVLGLPFAAFGGQ